MAVAVRGDILVAVGLLAKTSKTQILDKPIHKYNQHSNQISMITIANLRFSVLLAAKLICYAGLGP